METSQMSALEEVFISRANCQQRAGRAGRVRPGFCFRLFTLAQHSSFKAYGTPELLRVPLEELCLNIMVGGKTNLEIILIFYLLSGVAAIWPALPLKSRYDTGFLKNINNHCIHVRGATQPTQRSPLTCTLCELVESTHRLLSLSTKVTTRLLCTGINGINKHCIHLGG